MVDRIKPGNFGYEYDVLPEELTFCHELDGSLSIRPPEGKKVGIHFSRVFQIAFKLQEILRTAESTFSPFMGGDEVPPAHNVVSKTISDIRNVLLQADGRGV